MNETELDRKRAQLYRLIALRMAMEELEKAHQEACIEAEGYTSIRLSIEMLTELEFLVSDNVEKLIQFHNSFR
jgi:hypothetical protein